MPPGWRRRARFRRTFGVTDTSTMGRLPLSSQLMRRKSFPEAQPSQLEEPGAAADAEIWLGVADAMDAKLDLLEAHGLAAVAGPCRGVAGETGAGPQHPGGPRVTVEVAASRRRLAVGTGPRPAAPIIPGAPWRLSDLV